MTSRNGISSIFILQKKLPPPPHPYQLFKISSIITRQQQQQQQQLHPKLSSTNNTLPSTPQTQSIAHPSPNPIKSSSRTIKGQKTYPSQDPRTASLTCTPSSSSSSSMYCLTGSEYYWTGNRRSSAVVAVAVGGGRGVDDNNKKNENCKSENIWWHWREERWNVACG